MNATAAAAARGLAIAFVLFAVCFMLHIVGGALDQGWLFAVAVALIYLTAAGYPAIAAWFAGASNDARWLAVWVGIPIGIVLTTAALRAANDRSMAWWVIPLAVVLVAVVSVAILALRAALVRGRAPARKPVRATGYRR